MKDVIIAVLTALEKERPVFWSEADFQFSFAWELHNHLPDDAKIRLERREEIMSRLKRKKVPAYIDIWVEYNNMVYPIELKYKTRSLMKNLNNETFELKTQGACDVGGHNFINDIWRIEQLSVSKPEFDKGFAIMITNDPTYWTKPEGNDETAFRDFRLYDRPYTEQIRGTLAWYSAGGNTKEWQDKEGPITLKHAYPIHWEEYSDLEVKNGIFKYLLVEVTK